MEPCIDVDEHKFKPKYEFINGGFFEEKPEYMTHIYGNKIVYKDHDIIAFRGKVDSFQSEILLVQVAAVKAKKESLAVE